jgi:hypothetical protein
MRARTGNFFAYTGINEFSANGPRMVQWIGMRAGGSRREIEVHGEHIFKSV